MNKRLLNSAIAFATMALLIACSDDDNKIEPTPTAPAPSTPTSKGAYVLSSGYWGENNASIQYIDLENHRVINDDMYFHANGEKLGDSGQDLLLYGSKLYCTVSTSEKVVIMDKSCKVLKSHSLYVDPDILPNDIIIDSDPRYLAAHNGKVYFTSYDGTVSRIDTATLEIEAKVNIGNVPEAITVANDKLYVNLSNYGSGNRVAVIDIATFTKIKEIRVALNPYSTCFTGSDGYVYVISNGNYAGDASIPESEWVYSTLQRIYPETDMITEEWPATFACQYGDDIYAIYSEYYLPATHKCVKYNLVNKGETDFIDLDEFKFDGYACANSINVNPANGDAYVCCTPWGQYGVVKVFNKQGDCQQEYTVGYCPSKVIFTE